MTNKFEMFWKEFKVLSHHLPGEFKKNHGKRVVITYLPLVSMAL
jgi:hypothetical protein